MVAYLAVAVEVGWPSFSVSSGNLHTQPPTRHSEVDGE